MSFVVSACVVALASAEPRTLQVMTGFDAWKAQQNKAYATPEAEKKAALAWMENDRIIKEHNAGDSSYKMGHNEFSDLTLAEFKEKFLDGKKSEFIDDDGNVIKVPGAQYDEMGVRKLYSGQEDNELADEAAKKIAGV